MSVYLDTSALVKRYAPRENRASIILALFSPNAAGLVFVSSLAGVEFASAITRKRRRGELGAEDARLAWETFTRDFPFDFQTIQPEAPVLQNAERLVFAHGLRAYDAVAARLGFAARRGGAPEAGRTGFLYGGRGARVGGQNRGPERAAALDSLQALTAPLVSPSM